MVSRGVLWEWSVPLVGGGSGGVPEEEAIATGPRGHEEEATRHYFLLLPKYHARVEVSHTPTSLLLLLTYLPPVFHANCRRQRIGYRLL